MLKKSLAVLVAIGVTLGLTACNPPMPPEVRAALEEQIIVCEPGESSIYLPGAALDQSYAWNDALTVDCPEMVLSDALDLTSANLIGGFATDAPEVSGAYAQIPFGVDAAVFLVNSADMGALAPPVITFSDIRSLHRVGKSG